MKKKGKGKKKGVKTDNKKLLKNVINEEDNDSQIRLHSQPIVIIKTASLKPNMEIKLDKPKWIGFSGFGELIYS